MTWKLSNQYLCLEGERPVGAFVLNDNPQGAYENGNWTRKLWQGEYLVIQTLATDPEIYHRGIGKYMVNYCLEKAKSEGYRAVRLDVVPDNLPARKIYETMGFSYAGETDLERNIEEIPKFALYERNF